MNLKVAAQGIGSGSSNLSNGRSVPRMWFVSPGIGRPSEPWLWRQFVTIERLEKRVITWSYENPELHRLAKSSLHLMPTTFRMMQGFRRWWIRLYNLRGLNFYGATSQEKWFLRSLFSDWDPEVILCHFGHTALRLLPVAQEASIPLVAHFHGLDLSSSLNEDRWYRWSLLKNLERFAAVVVVGEHQKKWILDRGFPRERLHLIPCGAPVHDYTVRMDKSSDRVRFIAVSRLVAWKGVDYTIRAFSEVLKTFKAAELLIVGDGPERNALALLAEALGLKDSVIFVGSCSSDKVRDYYESSHVFVQHSITHSNGWVEGFGVTIVEAAASGLPVVVTRSGGIGPQVIDGISGFLVDERNIGSMAEAMLLLAKDNAKRTQMGYAGRQHVEANFSTEGQVKKLERAMIELVSRRRETFKVEDSTVNVHSL
jgi:colanic acid/amylovoran biosynthesis glycosyltransferase